MTPRNSKLAHNIQVNIKFSQTMAYRPNTDSPSWSIIDSPYPITLFLIRSSKGRTPRVGFRRESFVWAATCFDNSLSKALTRAAMMNSFRRYKSQRSGPHHSREVYPSTFLREGINHQSGRRFHYHSHVDKWIVQAFADHRNIGCRSRHRSVH